MAFKVTLLCLLASFFLVTMSVTSIEAYTEPPYHTPVPLPPMVHPPTHFAGCVPLCEERCKTHRKKRPCMKVCTKCCKKCEYCVPPGTSGNGEKCKNWDEVIIHGQKYKCP